MSELLHRTFTAELELGDDGRTVEGLAVPFGEVAEVADIGPRGVVRYREQFVPGAFDRAVRVPHRVTYVYGHSDAFGDRLGVGHTFTQRDDGLHVSIRLDASRAEQARDAITSSHGALSIGFVSRNPKPYTEREGELITRRAVHLVHIAAVPKGAYAGAVVGSVREEAELEMDEEERAEREAEAVAKAEERALLASIDEMVASQEAWRDRLGMA